MVELAHGFDDVLAQLGHLQRLAEQVQVEQGADVVFAGGVAQRGGVEPADEEAEGQVFGLGHAVGFGARGFGRLVVEEFGEEGAVVAEEFFVQDPVVGVRADVDVDHSVGEESALW